MSYAIVGFGKIGEALAHAFARKNIDVTVANRRPPEELDGLPSSAFVAKSFTSAKFVKGFNPPGRGHAGDRSRRRGGHRVVFCRATTRTRSLPWRIWLNNRVRARRAGKAQRGWRGCHAGGRTWASLSSRILFQKER